MTEVSPNISSGSNCFDMDLFSERDFPSLGLDVGSILAILNNQGRMVKKYSSILHSYGQTNKNNNNNNNNNQNNKSSILHSYRKTNNHHLTVLKNETKMANDGTIASINEETFLKNLNQTINHPSATTTMTEATSESEFITTSEDSRMKLQNTTTESLKLDKMEEELTTMLESSDTLWQETFKHKLKLNTLNLQHSKVEGMLCKMEKDVSEKDQYRRRENIEIIGIPTSVTEDQLLPTVLKILRNIGLWDLQPCHILRCERLPKEPRQKYPSVFVRFAERKHAIQTHELKRKLRSVEHRLGFKSLHIVDNLCPYYKELFERCQQLRDLGTIGKVWTHKGVVNFNVGKGNNRPVKVFHLGELDEKFRSGVDGDGSDGVGEQVAGGGEALLGMWYWMKIGMDFRITQTKRLVHDKAL